VRWRPLPVLGARYATLARDPVAGTFVSVARMGGGRRFPRHRHVGDEQVVVLRGAYGDEVGDFAAGDWGSYPDGSQHAPRTVAGEDCWILTRLHHPVRFFGWRGVLQKLLGV
jgi:anti-sigma factor ChrR (cupin superfamily)